MTQHLSLPLRVSDTGSLAAHAVGSPAEVGQSVALLLTTQVGERRSEPAYGSDSGLFAPTDAVVLDAAAVREWEPRATDDLVAISVTAIGGRP